MKTFKTTDGEKFSGATAEDVVTQMRRASVNEEPTNAEYMREAAKRYSRVYGVIIRADHPGNFIADLLAGGIIKEIQS